MRWRHKVRLEKRHGLMHHRRRRWLHRRSCCASRRGVNVLARIQLGAPRDPVGICEAQLGDDFLAGLLALFEQLGPALAEENFAADHRDQEKDNEWNHDCKRNHILVLGDRENAVFDIVRAHLALAVKVERNIVDRPAVARRNTDLVRGLGICWREKRLVLGTPVAALGHRGLLVGARGQRCQASIPGQCNIQRRHLAGVDETDNVLDLAQRAWARWINKREAERRARGCGWEACEELVSFDALDIGHHDFVRGGRTQLLVVVDASQTVEEESGCRGRRHCGNKVAERHGMGEHADKRGIRGRAVKDSGRHFNHGIGPHVRVCDIRKRNPLRSICGLGARHTGRR
eukprot:comp22009_c0_seq1/m.50558 comp22009_c0_seq1/g.50558  ORF comp22009_c0_seq1/g.50558 comp22009_c0_seq1/m.50558 type:complete len:345 (-) comp22009_c0_seq1:994-2028(-)